MKSELRAYWGTVLPGSCTPNPKSKENSGMLLMGTAGAPISGQYRTRQRGKVVCALGGGVR